MTVRGSAVRGSLPLIDFSLLDGVMLLKAGCLLTFQSVAVTNIRWAAAAHHWRHGGLGYCPGVGAKCLLTFRTVAVTTIWWAAPTHPGGMGGSADARGLRGTALAV